MLCVTSLQWWWEGTDEDRDLALTLPNLLCDLEQGICLPEL